MEEEICEDFDEFSKLPISLQEEAIREGEARLQAQLAVATAADARALAWGGMLATFITASLGTGLALMSKEEPDYLLATLALLFASVLVAAVAKAFATATPGEFHLPGNIPSFWLPPNWECPESVAAQEGRARRDQAEALAKATTENRLKAAAKASMMRSSFEIAAYAVWGGGIGLFAILLFRIASQGGSG